MSSRIIHFILKSEILGPCHCVRFFQQPARPFKLAGLSHSSNLRRSGSIKDLIDKFSGSDPVSPISSPKSPTYGTPRLKKALSVEVLDFINPSPSTSNNGGQDESPSVSVNSQFTDNFESGDKSAKKDTTPSQATLRTLSPAEGNHEKSDSKATKKGQILDSGIDSGMGSVSKDKS